MENQRNNNNMMQICSTTPNVQLTSSTQNVSSVACSSITPLRINHRLFNLGLNRLTAVKRLARNRRKTYQKYGPYPCKWCDEKFPTSQYFASHMRSHYIDERNALNADKPTQKDEPQFSPAEAQAGEQKRANLALRYAKAELKKAIKRTEELTLLLAQANAAKAKADRSSSKK